MSVASGGMSASVSRGSSQNSLHFPPPPFNSVTASFDISRKLSLKSGSLENKLHIAEEDLPAQFIRYCLPQQSTSCILQVRAQNNFKYPMLQSHQAAVFIDGSFLYKTNVPAAPIGSKFDAFLGTDPTINVKLLPRKIINKESGIINKTHKTTFEYPCMLKNCQNGDVRAAVVQQLPRSSDDKIKVSLLTPLKDTLIQVRAPADDVGVVYAEEEDGAGAGAGTNRRRGNAEFRVLSNKTTNNITWDVMLEPQVETEILFSYTVEWPSDKEIDYRNTFQ